MSEHRSYMAPLMSRRRVATAMDKAIQQAVAERSRYRDALKKIAAGKEVRCADGTTQVVDRDDAMEIAQAALAKAEPSHDG